MRNTRVIDIVEELKTYGIKVLVHDPLADPHEAEKYYNIALCSLDAIHHMNAVIIATAHKSYREMSLDSFTDKLNSKGSLIDVKSILDPEKASTCGYWFLAVVNIGHLAFGIISRFDFLHLATDHDICASLQTERKIFVKRSKDPRL